MKILNLYFKNINSLEGESRIDFTQSPLANVGVFAIVGPNGSGKSSILDAISLALYGETFRFDRPAEQVMTAHSSESFAQVEFAIATQQFRTRWQMSRANLQAAVLPMPQMQLVGLSEEGETLLADSVQTVCAKMLEITGMDFRNFSRSIILAQGDFASFLNALDSERMDILEKMSSDDVYAVQKQQLQHNYQQAQAAVQQIEQELALLPLMDAGALEASEQDLADFKEQVIEFKKQQQLLQAQHTAVEAVNALQQQLILLTENQQKTQQHITQKHAALENCVAVQAATAFAQEVQAIEQLQQQVEQSNKTCNAVKLELNQLKNQLARSGLSLENLSAKSVAAQKQVIDDLKQQLSQLKLELSSQANLHLALNKQLKEKQAFQANTIHWLDTHAADKSLLSHFPDTSQLLSLRAELIELDAQHQLSSRKFKLSDNALKKNTAAIEQAKKTIADLHEQLLYAEKDADDTLEHHTLTDLEILHVEQQQRVIDFNELYSIAKVNEKLSARGFWRFFSRAVTEAVDLTPLKRQLDDLNEQIAQAKNIKNVLEQTVLNEVLIQRLRHERPHLVDGKPCPLCGALQHPYAILPPKAADSRQALTNQKIHLQDLLSQADTLNKQIAAIEKQTEDNLNKDKQLQKIRSEFITLGNKLNVGSSEFGLHNVSGLKQLLKEEQAELTRIKSLLKRYAQQQDKLTRIKLHLEKEQYALQQLEQTREQLTSDTYNLPHELLEIETNLSRYQAQEKQVAAQVEEQLRSLGEPMPDKEKEAALFERLAARKRDYQTYLLREKALAEELTPLVEKIAETQHKIEQYRVKADELSALLAAEEAVGLQLNVLDKQSVLQTQEQRYADLQRQLQNLQQAFNASLAGSQFSSFKQVQVALALFANQADLQQQLASLTQQSEKLSRDIEKCQAQLAAAQGDNVSHLSLAELTAQQRSVKEKLAIANEEIRHIEEKQRRQADLSEKHARLSAQLQQLQQQLTAAQTELALSESNGMAFRRQVQLRMIAQLLTHANKMLEKISGRYYLRQLPTEQGLALEIEDTQQQSVRRAPQSLSGGEQFIISLALALGLSELANNGKAVDSLFLDEGFGSLDPEMLNTVVNTLQSLQYHGKTVGVISHVDAVKKRIKTRIEMVKKPNGLSQLKKVS